jgi:tetratricopeptide (TPR) repeat protein
MSLINNMLQDLEERHALAGIRDDKVLGDLHAAHEQGFPGRANHALHPVFLLLTGLLICYLGYDFYSAWNTPEPAALQRSGISRQPASGSVAVITTAGQPSGPAPAGDPPSGREQSIALKLTSLRMDTSAFKTTRLPAVEDPVTDAPVITPQSADSAADVPAPARSADTNQALPGAAAVAPANELLHIALTDLEGGSSVQVNTSAYPDFSLFLLDKPKRLLVEVKDLDMPAGIVDAPYRSAAVARLRHGSRDNIGLLIFDLNRPVAINSTDIRERPDGGYSLDIELLTAAEPGAPSSAAAQPLVQPAGGTAASGEASGGVMTQQTFQKNASVNGDAGLFTDAMSAYRTGDVVRTIDLLYQLLNKDPHQVQARTTLATILLQQQDRLGAVKVLSEGLRLHPDNTDLIKLYANLLFDEGRLDQTLAWLRKASPDISRDPEYYALMAVVLQRRKDYLEAGELYRKLVAIRPASGVWWMGLGISLEGSGRSGEALQAYANARRDRTLAPGLTRYLDARIKTLGG